MAGSAFMLIAILALVYTYFRAHGVWTFDLMQLQNLDLPYGMQVWMFLAFALAFAIKVPLFPFHTWLPDAHVEAPTAGSVILAGVLLKMGTYGFVRFCLPLFPEASRQAVPVIAVLSIIGIIYGAMVAFCPTRCKESGRLLQREPPRIRHAWPVRPESRGRERRNPADGEPTA